MRGSGDDASALAPFQGVFYAFPDLTEWAMNDLYDRHPDKPFLWRYRGRKDDVIVLSNGEKIAPALMEATLASCPTVRGAMVVGRGRFHPMALVDLHGRTEISRDSERSEILAELEPFIEAANAHAPAHARLDRRHVIFADPCRPIEYLGQGKIQRRRTYEVYEADIEAAYKAAEEQDVAVLPEKHFTDREETLAWLRQLVAGAGGTAHLAADDDFFRAGIDSLQVMRLAREIPGASATDIYRHHTLSTLAAFLERRRRDSSSESESDGGDTAPTETSADDGDLDDMRTLLDSCVADLPRIRGREDEEAMTVLLTGSTGSLGSYLLDTLYHMPRVARIICLNRTADSETRQASGAGARGLSSSWDPARVSFLQADLSAPFLGLAPAAYQDLVDTVTHVVHNQWPVNFHWRVASFGPFVRGVRNLADFCLASSSPPQKGAVLLFVSSVSAVGAWRAPSPVPEEPVSDLGCAAMGYGRAKLVSERLLAEATATSGLRAAVCRVGIVAGPVERAGGMWNRHEYIPAVSGRF